MTFTYLFSEVFSSANGATTNGLTSPSEFRGVAVRNVARGKNMYRKTRRVSLWMTFVTALCFAVCWGQCKKGFDSI